MEILCSGIENLNHSLHGVEKQLFSQQEEIIAQIMEEIELSFTALSVAAIESAVLLSTPMRNLST